MPPVTAPPADRNIGNVRLSRSNRARTCSQSGIRSSINTVTIVDRSRGSVSIAHVNASVWRMNSAIVISCYTS